MQASAIFASFVLTFGSAKAAQKQNRRDGESIHPGGRSIMPLPCLEEALQQGQHPNHLRHRAVGRQITVLLVFLEFHMAVHVKHI